MNPLKKVAKILTAHGRQIDSLNRSRQIPNTSVTLDDGTERDLTEGLGDASDALSGMENLGDQMYDAGEITDSSVIDRTFLPEWMNGSASPGDIAFDLATKATIAADEANSKANELARVPARVEGLQVASNVGVWGVGAQADITVSWGAVTEDVLGGPIDVVGYEVFDKAAPVAIVAGLTATFRVPAGSGHEFVVRAGSAAGIWGDVSAPAAAVAASPALATRTPTAPALSTGFGLVVARWDGTYVDGGTAGAHTVTLERQEAQTWLTEGVALQATGSVTMRGAVGTTVTVRFVARDMVGRVTGTSDPTSIEVASVKGGDIDPEDIWANEAWVNALSAGIIRADWLEPNIGDSLNISANESVLIMVGHQAEQDAATALAKERADEALAQAEGLGEKVGEALGTAEGAAAAAAGADLVAQHAQERLDEIAAVTRFSVEGIELGTADWSQELRLRPDYAAIVQNGTEVSRWEAGRMIVNEMVVNQARIANHLVSKHGTSRTIFRPIT